MAINEDLVDRMSIGGKDLPGTKNGAKGDEDNILKSMNMFGGSFTDGSGFDGNQTEVVRRLARKVEQLNETIINMANQNPELNILLASEHESTYTSERSSESEIECWAGEVPDIPIEDENAKLDLFRTSISERAYSRAVASVNEVESWERDEKTERLNTVSTSERESAYSSRYSSESESEEEDSEAESKDEKSWKEAVSPSWE